jgi:hypothetical protein
VSCSNEEEGLLGRSHIVCRNCPLKRVIEGKMEVTGIQGRRRKEILDYLQETRRYWKLKDDAPELFV